MTNYLEARIENIIRQEIVKQKDIEYLKILINEEIEEVENDQFRTDHDSFFRTLDYKLKEAIETASEAPDIVELIKQEAIAFEIVDIGCVYDLTWSSDEDICKDLLTDFFMRRRIELNEYVRIGKF